MVCTYGICGFVCVCACMYARTGICICAYMCVICMHACVDLWTCIGMYVCMDGWIRVHVWVRMYGWMTARVYLWMVDLCMYVRMYGELYECVTMWMHVWVDRLIIIRGRILGSVYDIVAALRDSFHFFCATRHLCLYSEYIYILVDTMMKLYCGCTYICLYVYVDTMMKLYFGSLNVFTIIHLITADHTLSLNRMSPMRIVWQVFYYNALNTVSIS